MQGKKNVEKFRENLVPKNNIEKFTPADFVGGKKNIEKFREKKEEKRGKAKRGKAGGGGDYYYHYFYFFFSYPFPPLLSCEDNANSGSKGYKKKKGDF